MATPEPNRTATLVTPRERSRLQALIGSRERALPATRAQPAGKDALRRRLLACADVLAVALGAGIVAVGTGDNATGLVTLALLPGWLLLAKALGLYERDHTRLAHGTSDELAPLLEWAALASAGSALVFSLVGTVGFTAGEAVLLFAVVLAAAVTGRTAARMLWARVVEPERALIVGEGVLADAFMRKLVLEPVHHVRIVATLPQLDAEPLSETLAAQIEDDRIERVVVTSADLDEVQLAQAIGTCRGAGIKLSVAPPLHAMLGTAVNLSHLAELPVVEFRTWNQARSTMLLKRAIDVIGASILLVVALPVLAVIAICVRIDSAGPALFRQTRAGRNGRPFRILKFRTMVRDAEQRLPDVVDLDGLPTPMFKLQSDPRVTRVGRVLRRTSLDELPQLFNVLRGDMSLVGPRPEELRITARYSEPERFRLQMRPGLTGPMQIHGRGELTWAERIAVEREYVENHSISKDLRILLRTLGSVVRGRGAF